MLPGAYLFREFAGEEQHVFPLPIEVFVPVKSHDRSPVMMWLRMGVGSSFGEVFSLGALTPHPIALITRFMSVSDAFAGVFAGQGLAANAKIKSISSKTEASRVRSWSMDITISSKPSFSNR